MIKLSSVKTRSQGQKYARVNVATTIIVQEYTSQRLNAKSEKVRMQIRQIMSTISKSIEKEDQYDKQYIPHGDLTAEIV